MSKKKILIVVNHFEYSNGVASALRNMLMNINYEKYDISLLALYKFDPKFAEPVLDKITIVRGIGTYFRGLDRIISVIPLRAVYKLFVKDKYDLEVAYQYGLPTKLVAQSRNDYKICWIHTYDEGLTLRKFYEKYQKLVTVARIGYEKLLKDGMPSNKCAYCYNVIDQNLIIEKSNERIDVGNEANHRVVFITVARTDPDKAYERLFKCISDMKNELEGRAEFWVVGSGCEEEKLRQYIELKGLDNIIVMFGAQQNPYKYMAQADIYLCASYREGFSTSCQEAAIMGLPVVSVNVDGAHELIQIANCGLVVENSVDGLKNGILRVVEDRNKVEKWKDEAQKNKIRFYKDSRMCKIEQLFDNVLSTNERRED